MKALRIVTNVLAISTMLCVVNPTIAQTAKDTSSTTKANGSGAGTGVSQGAPGAATVSGTGTGTLADSNSIAGSDTGLKSAVTTGSPKTSDQSSGGGHSNWGLLGLFGLLGLLGLRKSGERVNH
jgi:MYXO-CTERM domain-containing protein